MHIGVVIPLFKQSQYLIECVTSVLDQTLAPTGIVIVNDGCPDPLSDSLPRAFVAAWPELVLYLRQENLGLSGARNAGIRALLNRWPEIEAIFPLDADDWVDRRALEAMAARLGSEDRPDWVYPDVQRFGSDFINWKPWSKLNPFRLVFKNQCVASCLIRRDVFDAGLLYDETMREGFEDWEFFLRAVLRGFTGASAGQVGFYYRVKDNSMLKEAAEKYNQLVKSMHQRHPSLLQPRHLTAYEHKYMPRFRFIDEQRRVHDFSDPRGPPAWDQTFDLEYVPPITILGSAAGFEFLNRSGTLRGVLFSIQRDLRTQAWRIDLVHRQTGIRVERKQGLEQNPVLFAFETKWLMDGLISTDNIQSFVAIAKSLSIGASDHRMFGSWNAFNFQPLVRHAFLLASSEVKRTPGPLEEYQASGSWFARHHLGSFESTYPLTYADGVDVCFAVSSLRLDGVGQCVLKLAGAVKRLVKDVRIHLLLTDAGIVDADRVQISVFDEIVSMAHCKNGEQLQVLSSIMRSMDIVINAHSRQAYEALRLLPKRSQSVHRPVCISYLYMIDPTANENLSEYPYVAPEYECEIDCFLVSPEQVRDFLLSSGVNEERIRIGRNAPVVRPRTRRRAFLLTNREAARKENMRQGTASETPPHQMTWSKATAEGEVIVAEFRKAVSQLGELRRRETHLLRAMALLEFEQFQTKETLEIQSAKAARLQAELGDARHRVAELDSALEVQARQLVEFDRS
jgi:glycosyltransferase involved in cell wall biosynthesis